MKRFTYIQFVKFQQQFLKEIKKQKKSINTINSYRTDFGTFSEFTKKKNLRSKICFFTLTNAKTYSYYLDEKYNSSNSRRKKIQSIRIFYDYLVEQKIIKENPFKALATSPKILNTPSPTTVRDMEKLWKEFSKEEKSKSPRTSITAKRDKCVFLLIIGCNLRPYEVSKLKQSHLVLNNSNSGRVLITSNKNKEPYTKYTYKITCK